MADNNFASQIAIAAVCETCWLATHSRWEPEGVFENGSISVKLVGVEVPEKVNDGSVEVCAVCEAVTVAGIYDMVPVNRRLYRQH
jgi:hypothetical protein